MNHLEYVSDAILGCNVTQRQTEEKLRTETVRTAAAKTLAEWEFEHEETLRQKYRAELALLLENPYGWGWLENASRHAST